MPFGTEAAEIQRGTEPRVVQGRNHYGLNICFDSCYPWIIRDTARLNPDLICLPTLDPHTPTGFLEAVHAAYTPFRAAEVGIPIIRAEKGSWSMIVDIYGRILRIAPVDYSGMIAVDMKLEPHTTFYRTVGEWVPVACLLGLLFLIVQTRARQSQVDEDLESQGAS